MGSGQCSPYPMYQKFPPKSYQGRLSIKTIPDTGNTDMRRHYGNSYTGVMASQTKYKFQWKLSQDT